MRTTTDFAQHYPRQFEEAQATATGALVGHMIATTGSGPQWTEAFHQGFCRAVREAFNHGVRIGKASER